MSSQHVHGAFCGHFTPSSTRWWGESIKRHYTRNDPEDYGHFGLLLEMIDSGHPANDLEALEYCYGRVVHEAARSVSGLWCVCLDEVAPPTVGGQGNGKGDGFSSLLAVRCDLESAADTLPIAWTSTQRVFEAQSREHVWQARYRYYRRNLGVREIDRWQEPRDRETGRSQSTALTYFMMSLALHGSRTFCEWPRPASIVQRLAFRALAQEAA